MPWADRASEGGLFGDSTEVDETSAADADVEDVSPDVVRGAAMPITFARFLESDVPDGAH